MSARRSRAQPPAGRRSARSHPSAVTTGLLVAALVVPLSAAAHPAAGFDWQHTVITTDAHHAVIGADAHHTVTGPADRAASTAPDGEPLPGYPLTVDGLEVAFRTAEATIDPLGLTAEPFARVTPTLGFQVANTSDVVRVVGLATDLAAPGEMLPLWDADTWGGSDAPHAHLRAPFAAEVAPGAVWPADDGFLAAGLTQWPGRTVAIVELDALPQAGGEAVTELAAIALPGRFVPVTPDADGESSTVGVPVTVAGAPASLFPGATASVRAEALPAGADLEVWLVPATDAFTVQLQGGALPATAVQVGAGPVSSEGVFEAAFTVPDDATSTGHTILVGTSATRWWPASGGILVAPATETQFAVADAGAAEHVFTLADAPVTVAARDAAAGRTTATLSATGPAPIGFAPDGDAPGFMHLSSSADAAEFTVCVPAELPVPASSEDAGAAADDAAADADSDPGAETDADADATDEGPAPTGSSRLYQHRRVGAFDHQWVDLTSSVVSVTDDDTICAQTTSLGVFTRGHPVDDGSQDPPADGILSHDDGGPLADGDFTITVDLFAGENARMVRLYEDGELIGHRTLTLASPGAQQARFAIVGRADGTYVYTAELENSRGVTVASPLTVEVTDASPATPALAVNGPRGGSFTLTARTLWGTNATSYAFVEDGATVAEGALTAASPGPQIATLTVNGKAAGVYEYTVVFRNAAGETASTPLEVIVE